MSQQNQIILNALSATGAGGFSVARALAHSLAEARPDWRFTLLLIGGFRLHEQIQPDQLPANCTILRGPPETQHRLPRRRYERALFPELMAKGASASLQLNGMMPPGAGRLPVLAHNQDPWPYRPEAWEPGLHDRTLAMFRRRAHRRGLKRADVVGFTSNYLRELMTRRLGVAPRKSEVFYNGLPDAWIDRAAAPLPPWRDRPMELISVSSVAPYKRQELVIRCMPELVKRPGLGELVYRIVGHHNDPAYSQSLRKLATDLGVGGRVMLEGRVPDDCVEQLMRSSRAFVLMSVCESFGLPAVEAMSFGTPVVVSNCCAMPEVCGDGAILSPVDDVPALTDNLHRVLTDESLAEPLRQRGARNVQRFRWSDTAQQMVGAPEQITAAEHS